MRFVKLLTLAALAVGLLAGLVAVRADDPPKPKYTIKEIMGKANAGDNALAKKVISGDAEQADKDKLVELYTALTLNMPPKGDADSWKEKTAVLLEAAKAAADKDGSPDKLKSALAPANCGACHAVHKIPKPKPGG
jgi:predicted RecA/RadA family phage recombinase